MIIPKLKTILINKREIIIVALFLTIALVSYLITNNNKQGAIVRIEIGQVLYGDYSLSKNQEIFVNDSHGHNLLKCRIKDNAIRVTYSTCPDKICVKQGRISSSGQAIVCLPNKVVISIINSSDTINKIDGVLK